MPGLKDCAVFGVPDAEFGEALMAVVEPQPGITLAPADVSAYLTEHLAGYKVPRRIEFSDDLPRTPTGKLLKRLLRDPYWEGTGRSI
jgi:long-chain acyl-CoA synthetase